ncbi:MAG: hypothetical protein KC593_20335 [Myxococcales bacterium]|nr:hypothetical protein [Myxococcales bacterium]MCA9613525.1 hypothetical protein [Myxococcales bacterium]
MTKHALTADRVHRRPPTRWLSTAVARLALFACVALSAACGKSDGTFTACVATPDCGGGRQCFQLGSGAGVCLTTCANGQALCAQGEACAPTATADEDWVCLPGGNIALGGVCARSIDCDLGGVCITEGSFSICRRACDPRIPNCSAGSMCSAFSAERGYCAPIVQTPDMGMTSADGG